MSLDYRLDSSMIDLPAQEIRKALDYHGFIDATHSNFFSYYSSAEIRGPGMYMLFSYALGETLPGSHRKSIAMDTNLESSLSVVNWPHLIMDVQVNAYVIDSLEEPPTVGVLPFVYRSKEGPDYDYPTLEDYTHGLRADPGDRVGAWVIQRTECKPFIVRVTMSGLAPRRSRL